MIPGVPITVETAGQLKKLRRTERMLATKAQNQADSHRAKADAVTEALRAMGVETENEEQP
ncbi:MAG: hypothetical protein ITG02_01080 [Patulibacter sp.]|nr:hypothetical protein [Patulibacter sp.]